MATSERSAATIPRPIQRIRNGVGRSEDGATLHQERNRAFPETGRGESLEADLQRGVEAQDAFGVDKILTGTQRTLLIAYRWPCSALTARIRLQ